MSKGVKMSHVKGSLQLVTFFAFLTASFSTKVFIRLQYWRLEDYLYFGDEPGWSVVGLHYEAAIYPIIMWAIFVGMVLLLCKQGMREERSVFDAMWEYTFWDSQERQWRVILIMVISLVAVLVWTTSMVGLLCWALFWLVAIKLLGYWLYIKANSRH